MFFRRAKNKPRRHDGEAESLLAGADAARDDRDWPQAKILYRSALNSGYANSPGIWVQYGHACKESGDLNGAAEAYERGLQLAPQDADIYLQIGHLRKLLGRPIAAAAAYFWAYRLDQRLTGALDEFAWIGFSRNLANDLLHDSSLRAQDDVIRLLYQLHPGFALEATSSRWMIDRQLVGDSVKVRRVA